MTVGSVSWLRSRALDCGHLAQGASHPGLGCAKRTSRHVRASLAAAAQTLRLSHGAFLKGYGSSLPSLFPQIIGWA